MKRSEKAKAGPSNIKNPSASSDPESYRAVLQQLFWSKVKKTKTCWIWDGWLTSCGYGRFDPPRTDGVKPWNRAAHRVAYEITIGEIPAGKVIHHKCGNKSCVRPSHLMPLTHKENVLLGDAAPAINARKTECKNGHPLEQFGSKRRCRECWRIRNRKRYHSGQRQRKGKP